MSAPAAVARALEANPELRIAEAERAAAQAEVDGASLMFGSNPELEGAVGPRRAPGGTTLDFDVGVAQRLEIFGQRGARIDAARARLTAAEARLQMRRIAIASEAREAHVRALAAAETVTAATEGRELAAQSLKAAEERFAAGASNRIDVNAARVEAGRAARELALAELRLATALGELQLLLALDPGTPLTLEGELPGPSSPAQPLGLAERAQKDRPDLTAARAELEAALADRTLAGREVWPSPRVGVSYAQEESAQIVQGTLAFELPVFNQNQGRRGVTSARVLQAERTLEALQRQIRSEVGLAERRYSSARRTAQTYAGGAAAAIKENLELINEAYRAGKVDFLELIVVRRQALEERRAAIDVLEELGLAEARLKRALGSIE